jgi:hypothetical protein
MREPLFRSIPLELLFWTGGILVLALLDPTGPQRLNLCLFRQLGIDFCPGCGLGQSISFLLHGDPGQSVQAHFLGPVAFTIIVGRIFVLTKNSFTIHRKEQPHA